MYVVDLHHFHLFGETLCLRVAGIGMALECPYSVIPCSNTRVLHVLMFVFYTILVCLGFAFCWFDVGEGLRCTCTILWCRSDC